MIDRPASSPPFHLSGKPQAIVARMCLRLWDIEFVTHTHTAWGKIRSQLWRFLLRDSKRDTEQGGTVCLVRLKGLEVGGTGGQRDPGAW